MSSIDALLLLADRYCAATSLASSTLSTKLFNDGKRLTAIRAGGDLGTRQFSRAVQWFSDHWPTSAEWPEGVDRPAAEQHAQAAE